MKDQQPLIYDSLFLPLLFVFAHWLTCAIGISHQCDGNTPCIYLFHLNNNYLCMDCCGFELTSISYELEVPATTAPVVAT
ncbi:hypothetical protein theurythT_05680 [Thalassotalea eurytherma]|uniref:DUF2946 domain-containing protein n=1 Tax=Thalassotalea eurytherma TaxID=1144278 RepID=A0ABQ6GYT7_9GAMM|nr:hypothetical protein theurythT_05680 [Thalassotalea eurytherma]